MIEYFGKVDEEGGLSLFNKSMLVGDLKNAFAGEEITVRFAKKRRDRSNSQLGYYFAGIVPIVQEGLRAMGYSFTKDQTHRFLTANWLFDEIISEKTGEVFQVPLSLKKDGGVTTARFNIFVEEIQRWAAEELGVVIPEPGEQTRMITPH